MYGRVVLPVVAVLAAVMLSPVPAAAGVTGSTHHKTYFAQGGDSQDKAYRPKTLEISGDGEILVHPAKWSSWTSTAARGHGTLRVDNCKPNCAQGHYKDHKVRMILVDSHKKCGKWFFTKLRINFTAKNYTGKRHVTDPVGPVGCSAV
jgi:hypothetical protein